MKIYGLFTVRMVIQNVFNECFLSNEPDDLRRKQILLDHFAKIFGWNEDECYKKFKTLFEETSENYAQRCFRNYLELYVGIMLEEDIIIVEEICMLSGIETRRLPG